MDGMIPLLAGAVSTVIFAGGTLPMLVKAARTKDLSSYSLGNIVLSNLGNVIQRHGPPGLASSERPFGRMHPGEAT